MKKKILLCLLTIIVLLGATGCRKDNMEDIDIVVTNYPNEYILTSIYGEHANINSVYPDGVNVNNYKITSKRLICSGFFVIFSKVSSKSLSEAFFLFRYNK